MDKVLSIIADNPALLAALREALEKEFSLEDFKTNYTNETLGSQVRACLVAKEGIRNALNKISQFKSQPEKKEIRNPAR